MYIMFMGCYVFHEHELQSRTMENTTTPEIVKYKINYIVIF